MESLFIVRYGEIALKGKNRDYFLHKLTFNIKRQMGGIHADTSIKKGRIFVKVTEEDACRAGSVLAGVFGIVGFAPVVQVKKEMREIGNAAVNLARELLPLGKKFKIEARRTDKSFPLNSYGIACALGDLLREQLPGLTVSLYDPDWILNIEIRESAYLYGPGSRGPGGLPVGSSGRGLLLLSGGIDSPAAGYLMAKRGLRVDFVYFHTPPYTSEKALEKVEKLTAVLNRYQPGGRLHVVPFTEIQLRINEKAAPDAVTLMSRASMMHAATLIARRRRALCLITGESLGQVASQTLESLAFTGSQTPLPVFRPLIGKDKVEIVTLAETIGTYETSILPHPDCCTLFAPSHPLTRPNMSAMQDLFRSLDLDDLIKKAAASTERVDISS
jgi:thiamine biosynthesis protein ThiI